MQSPGKYVDYLTSNGNLSKEEAKEIVLALVILAQLAFDEMND
jgi:polyhydroxyalkanoate synthesis regulator phasin